MNNYNFILIKISDSGGNSLDDKIIGCSNTAHGLPIPFSLENYYNRQVKKG